MILPKTILELEPKWANVLCPLFDRPLDNFVKEKEVFGSRSIPDWIMEQAILQPLSSVMLSPQLRNRRGKPYHEQS